jgi:molybdopterin synthase sulfur carrier subunit
MKITLKLFATLGDLLPPGAVANAAQLEIPRNTTPHQVIERFHVPRKMAHLVLCNGRFVEPEQRDRPTLKDGDVLAIWPPVAGG